MSLKKKELETIIRIAGEYGVRRVWLFGSSLGGDSNTEPNDIDLAAEGLTPDRFFSFCADLDMALDKPVDVVDMDGKNPMRHIVRDRGRVIYEHRGQGIPQRSRKTHKKHAGSGGKVR